MNEKIKIRPSHLERLFQCAVSVLREREVENEDSAELFKEIRERGITTHKVLETVLVAIEERKTVFTSSFITSLLDIDRILNSLGVDIDYFTQSDKEYIQDAIRKLIGALMEYGFIEKRPPIKGWLGYVVRHANNIWIEQRYKSKIVTKKGRVFEINGVSDLVLDLRHRDDLDLDFIHVEFKTGSLKRISDVESQLLASATYSDRYFAKCIWEDGSLGESLTPIVRLVVINVFFTSDIGVDVADYSYDDLLAFRSKFETMLKRIEEIAISSGLDNGSLDGVKGYTGKGCKFCPVLMTCPDVRKVKDKIAKLIKKGGLDMSKLSAKEIDYILIEEATLSSFLKAVSGYALEQVKNKALDLPSFTLGLGRGYRSWIDEEEVEKKFFKDIGEDIYEKKLKSPARLERLAGKNNIDDLVSVKRKDVLQRREVVAEQMFDRIPSRAENKGVSK